MNVLPPKNVSREAFFGEGTHQVVPSDTVLFFRFSGVSRETFLNPSIFSIDAVLSVIV